MREPKLPKCPSDLIPNPFIDLSLDRWVRCHVDWCSKKKYVGNRSMWNTRAHGSYVGSVSHGLVVGLLEIWAYTRVWFGNVCR
jgi:hypothetical protein